jgi:predicted AlkP superfamily pyrophosphatase or phosphodiesterase
MKRTVVMLVVGLTPRLMTERTPALLSLATRGAIRRLETVFPAVTCSVQSSFTTGLLPRDHGAVGNGWYDRELAEVMFWKQSNHLVRGEKIWEAAKRRDSTFTSAKLFWWYNMYSRADLSVTPRPIYWADGLKIPDIYTDPPELHGELVSKLGEFPLFNFWGPNASAVSSRWIAECAKHVYDTKKPTLALVYLPHLDYDLQRFGPSDPRAHRAASEVDAIAGELAAHVMKDGARLIVLSEYGITPVRGPIHVNRALREARLLRVRDELGREKLDAGASDAFAVSDHQVAHVYLKDPELKTDVAALLRDLEGVEAVLEDEGKRRAGIDHARCGDLVLVSRTDRWFSYYYWLDDDRAPEFARTVDIHRKPGYDPVELFVDPALPSPKLEVALTLARKMLGFRYLMELTPLDGSLVKGSHGRLTEDPADGPVFITSEPELLDGEAPIRATEVKELVLRHVFGRS